jgi:hypothetical protein
MTTAQHNRRQSQDFQLMSRLLLQLPHASTVQHQAADYVDTTLSALAARCRRLRGEHTAWVCISDGWQRLRVGHTRASRCACLVLASCPDNANVNLYTRSEML